MEISGKFGGLPSGTHSSEGSFITDYGKEEERLTIAAEEWCRLENDAIYCDAVNAAQNLNRYDGNRIVELSESMVKLLLKLLKMIQWGHPVELNGCFQCGNTPEKKTHDDGCTIGLLISKLENPYPSNLAAQEIRKRIGREVIDARGEITDLIVRILEASKISDAELVKPLGKNDEGE